MSAEPQPKVLDLVQALEDSLVKARAAAAERTGRSAYEHWCEVNRIAPPLVLDWDELSDDQRRPFLTAPITPIASSSEAP